ncbi:DgyrCDS5668 [Dimorphilus gyrociliatus]|uniref:mitogen-activated protein kinase kinase n=1 Tax=Dimorphilus gyrociliatus TaxID=2664684 RepID=A0A7I8VNA7_9ANNE|nr:DgyrCDS5668 [Dimorphilus gyrociliatus]
MADANNDILKDDSSNRVPSAPGKPEKINEGKREVTIEWSTPVNNGSDSIIDYEIQISLLNSNKWQTVPNKQMKRDTAGSTTCKILQLKENKKYLFRVRAINSSGYGEFSKESDIIKVHSLSIIPPPSEPPRRPQNLPTDETTITLNGQQHKVDFRDLLLLNSNLGRGAYGQVEKWQHIPSGTLMAVKRIPFTVNGTEQKRSLTDLSIIMRSVSCPFVVTFYGSLFRESEIWICMELMSTSLDKFYKSAYANNLPLKEKVLGKMVYCILSALYFLKTELKVIHRDVKPSNMLVNRQGAVKICDFGISGNLVDSYANTKDAGCKPYMAPERIEGPGSDQYTTASDVWSIGVSFVEIAKGKYPYSRWTTPFEMLKEVVDGEPPHLSHSDFSNEMCDCINSCLQKRAENRPSYPDLMQMTFIKNYKNEDISDYVCRVLDTMQL